ncbi:hypothetical protein HPP92_029031, partial [Vanilla planifolia]
ESEVEDQLEEGQLMYSDKGYDNSFEPASWLMTYLGSPGRLWQPLGAGCDSGLTTQCNALVLSVANMKGFMFLFIAPYHSFYLNPHHVATKTPLGLTLIATEAPTQSNRIASRSFANITPIDINILDYVMQNSYIIRVMKDDNSSWRDLYRLHQIVLA